MNLSNLYQHIEVTVLNTTKQHNLKKLVYQTNQSANTYQKRLEEAQKAKRNFCKNIWKLWNSSELNNKKSHDIIYTIFVDELYSQEDQQRNPVQNRKNFLSLIKMYGEKGL